MDTNLVTIGSAVAVFAGLFGFWWKLDSKIDSLDDKTDKITSKLEGKIESVRLASERSHKEIIERLGKIENTQATHTERFNTIGARIDCVEGKIDDLKRGS